MGTSLPSWDPHHCNDYLEHLNSSVGCWCVWYSACLPMVEICLKNSSIISIGCLYFFKFSCVVNIVYFWWSQLCNLCSVRWLFVYSNMAQWYYIVSQWRGYWVTFALVKHYQKNAEPTINTQFCMFSKLYLLLLLILYYVPIVSQSHSRQEIFCTFWSTVIFNKKCYYLFPVGSEWSVTSSWGARWPSQSLSTPLSPKWIIAIIIVVMTGSVACWEPTDVER